MSSSPSTIRVAIIGGGLTGAIVLRGLLRYPHISVDLYEPRPIFKEEGPGLSLSTQTQAVLAAIDPELEQCLDRAGAVYTMTEVRLATGPHIGREIGVNEIGERSQRNVGRQAFLTEMIDGIPPHILHPGTRISSVTELSPGQGLVLTFGDGSQKTYDIVIGADGTHGFTRQLVLGTNESLVKAQSTGFWGLSIKVPLQRAQQVMSTQYLDPGNPRQVCWIGDGTVMISDLLANGTDAQIVVYGKEDEEDEISESSWAKLFTPDEFRDLFDGSRVPVCQSMVDVRSPSNPWCRKELTELTNTLQLILSVYTVQIPAINQLEHRATPTYTSRNLCLIGDSAHSMLPFLGADASLAFEEALVLCALLGRVSSKAAIPVALQAYDQICRSRAEQAARFSAETGLLVVGRAPGVGVNADLIQLHLRDKFEFLRDFDVNAHRAMANAIMDQLLGAAVGWSS
ncbi:hypothetical protein M426DRAFT_27923 [Hypoxylon sp. CI-4A]|nr:hypothetical protein M426DRAFT_27923 [Hypoxylon sp. CI-4A]